MAAPLNPRQYKVNFSEFYGIGPNGNLWVEDCDAKELADRFGTPLFIISESQFRYTYRQFRDAFRSHYPDVEILFANKSSNGLAIRHIMNQEGAGGDCFGVNEMYLALLAGTNPKTLVLNGSNKQTEELEMAIQNGLCINIDAEDELDRIDAICRQHGPLGRCRHPPEARSRAAGEAEGRRHARPRHAQGAERQHEMGHDARADRRDRQARARHETYPAGGDAFPPQPDVERPVELRRDGARDDRLVRLDQARRPAGRRRPSTSAAAGPSANGTAPARAVSSTTSPRRPRPTMRGCAARRSRTRRRSAACRCPSCGSSPAARSPARPASRSARSAR